jgi:hypothetical protein
VDRKYDVCAEEKFKISKRKVSAEVARKQWVKTNVENHQLLALKKLFAEEQLAFLHINNQCNSFDKNLTRFGIVQISYEGKVHFIHRTIAEYYVADYFVKELTNETNISPQIWYFLLKKIFVAEEHRVIRAFIDGMLSRCQPSNKVMKQCGFLIHDILKDDLLTLHTAAGEGNANIIGLLLYSLEETGHEDTLGKLLLARHNILRRTVWHTAAENSHLDVLQTLWGWAKKVLTEEELKNMFLGKDVFSKTAWHMAAEKGQIGILHKLRNWAKEVLTQVELQKICS